MPLREALLALLIQAMPVEQAGEVPDDPALTEAALAASEAYFAAKDRGDASAAYAMLAPSMRAYLTADTYAMQAASFNAAAGKVGERRVVRLTWYRDPADAPAPGLYVAADFTSRFAALRLHCGYLMWRRMEDGALRLVREEQAFLDEASARRMPPEQLRSVPAKLGCVGALE